MFLLSGKPFLLLKALIGRQQQVGEKLSVPMMYLLFLNKPFTYQGSHQQR